MTIPAATQDRTLSDSGGRRSNQETMNGHHHESGPQQARPRARQQDIQQGRRYGHDESESSGGSRSRDQDSTDQEADVEPGQGHQMSESSGAHSPGDRPWQSV